MIDAAAFAMNLREEMARQNIKVCSQNLRSIWEDSLPAAAKGWSYIAEASYDLFYARRAPFRGEIREIARALGCDKSRLLTTRDDLEERVSFWKGVAMMHQEERYKHVQEIIELRAEVAALKGNTDPL